MLRPASSCFVVYEWVRVAIRFARRLRSCLGLDRFCCCNCTQPNRIRLRQTATQLSETCWQPLDVLLKGSSAPFLRRTHIFPLAHRNPRWRGHSHAQWGGYAAAGVEYL